MSKTLQTLIRKLREHSRLTAEDLVALNALSHTVKKLKSNEDLIRQGDDPDVSAVVVSGMVARYHLLQNGVRQYLSFHMAGDMPDSQALFIDRWIMRYVRLALPLLHQFLTKSCSPRSIAGLQSALLYGGKH